MNENSTVLLDYPEDLPPGLDCPQCASNNCKCEVKINLYCRSSYYDFNDRSTDVIRFVEGRFYKACFKNNVCLIVDEFGVENQFLSELERYFVVKKDIKINFLNLQKSGRYNPFKEV
ncbi:hypothetical protein [Priestia megaterium]|uniref:hypothetical protein n=1 Tax=Priestia megaterium TaxID=1404 RepID=UPI002E22FD69|nr:hypothetical protein [Priestia megaterium]